MSERRSTLLGWLLTLSVLLCVALVGLGVYGYQLYVDQAARLATLEAEGATAASAVEPAETPAAGTVTERMRPDEPTIETLRAELATAASAAEQATREEQALQLKLENAEQMRIDAEAALDASRSRITALETEIGAGGSVDTLVDANGQPLAALETVTPRDLATLGMELRLVERERDGARVQLDRALERITALETTPANLAVAPAAGPSSAVFDNAQIEGRVAELEAANQALVQENAALQATLAGVEAERTTLSEAAAAARADLQTRLAAVEGEQDLSAELLAELEAALAAADARGAELEASLAAATASRDTLDAERSELQARLEAATTAATTAAADAASRIEALESELASLTDALATEREALATADAEAEAATAIALEATQLAERAAEGDRAVMAERDQARAQIDELEALVAQLRDEAESLEADRATLEKATRDALEAQGEAHAAALASLTEERDRLQAELAAARSDVAALDDGPAQTDRNGDDSNANVAAALSAANERIAALESELEATVRLAAEIRSDSATVADPPADSVPLAPADQGVEAIERELADARARITTLQNLLFADWPVRPRPAPR